MLFAEILRTSTFFQLLPFSAHEVDINIQLSLQEIQLFHYCVCHFVVYNEG
jgi:hypothetical protein